MWIDTDLEKHMCKQLHVEFNKHDADYYYSLYCSAREYLENNIYPYIASAEPTLTDHSDRHIENVLNNAWNLINDNLKRFNSIELFLLCISILFHDSGNINGRDGHNKKIADIYEEVIGNDSSRNQERRLVLKIVKAHCGKSKRGDSDTLFDVEETASLYTKEIKIREVAGIIRFADELAEGPQRTSDYMLQNGGIAEKAKIYHKYASVTEVFIDKGNGRIALTYNVDYTKHNDILNDLLIFIYKRIIKVDVERRYCKYYTPVLEKIKRTDAQINISDKGEDLIELPRIELGDKYVLSDESVEDIIYNRYPELKIESIMEKIG